MKALSGGRGTGTSKGVLLETMLMHLKTKYGIKPMFTHSDKDAVEINALRTCFPEAKHQICLWHSLRSVKVRMAVIKRAPAPYNSALANEEFDWIDPKFIPIGQGGVRICFIHPH